MTGEVLPFGEGRKPSPDALPRIRAAKASLPDHDPMQDVLDALATAVEAIGAARHPTPSAASLLDDDQIKALTYSTERAAERGVGIYATRIRSWHQAIVGGAFVAGLTIGIMGTFYVASRQTAAEMDAARIEVPAVLSSIPASDLAAWSTLIRANPSPSALIAAGRIAPQANGQRAATITLWLDLPPRSPAKPQ